MTTEFGYAKNACIYSAIVNFARIKKLLGDTFVWPLHAARANGAKAILNRLNQFYPISPKVKYLPQQF
jgi:hypothetical protein